MNSNSVRKGNYENINPNFSVRDYIRKSIQYINKLDFEMVKAPRRIMEPPVIKHRDFRYFPKPSREQATRSLFKPATLEVKVVPPGFITQQRFKEKTLFTSSVSDRPIKKIEIRRRSLLTDPIANKSLKLKV